MLTNGTVKPRETVTTAFAAKMSKPGDSNDVSENIWMIRPCELYLDEWNECQSLRGRFHQSFTKGESKDCTRWKECYDNCIAYRKSKSLKDAERIIEIELERRAARLKSAKNNNVWDYRTSPPADWAKPLPPEQERLKLPTMSETSNKTTCTIL